MEGAAASFILKAAFGTTYRQVRRKTNRGRTALARGKARGNELFLHRKYPPKIGGRVPLILIRNNSRIEEKSEAKKARKPAQRPAPPNA